MTDTLPPLSSFRNEILGIESETGRMDELHLYHGAWCNRSCAFCCVNGSPEGAHTAFTEPVLQAAVAIVAHRGSLKIYGGEPTLDIENLFWMVGRLREIGFEGAITIFSNGLRPHPLIELLRQDARLFVVLNYSIFWGLGEEPLPPSARAAFLDFHAKHPERVFLSHDFTVAVGRQEPIHQREQDRYLPCFRCWPTLTSQGIFHACPFAVENPASHYQLGTIDSPPQQVRENFAHFLHGVDNELMPQAMAQGVSACSLCTVSSPPQVHLISLNPRKGARNGG